MLEDKIRTISEPLFEEHQAEIIKINILGGDKYKTVQILAEGKSGDRLGIDVLGKMSRDLSYNLDVEEVMDAKYNLEVSSPGLDRPLVKIEDYKKFEGFLIKVRLKTSIESEDLGSVRKIKGRVLSVEGESVKLSVTDLRKQNKEIEEKFEIEIPFSNIESANIEITDALIKEKGAMN